ncbi:MAG: hypothetical protein R3B70_10440 [Polyangiaceae bacterium]
MKKSYRLPADLVRRVKRVLRAKTETEAIVQCMREAAFMGEVERVLRETGGAFPDFESYR